MPRFTLPPRAAKDHLSEILDEATKARGKSIQLKGVAFADQLADEILKHANKMESYYSALKTQVGKDPPDEKTIKTLMNKVEAAQAWWKTAEVRVAQNRSYALRK